MTIDTNSSIEEIKNKIKKNPKYLNPCNTEFQEDVKRFGFLNGNKYVCFLQQNGIMKNPTEVESKFKEDSARRRGFKNYRECHRQEYQNDKVTKKEQIKKRRYIRGVQTPMDINKSCTASLGVDIGEFKIAYKILDIIFEYIEKMDYRNHGFDFICKNPRQEFIVKYPQFRLERDNEYKIDAKTRSLSHNGKDWSPDIDSNMPNYFLFNLLDNRKDLNLLHCLLIHKDEVINGHKLYKRDYLTITNNPKCLLPFKTFDLVDKIDIKDVCKDL